MKNLSARIFILIWTLAIFFTGFVCHRKYFPCDHNQKTCEPKWIKVEVPITLPENWGSSSGCFSFWVKVDEDAAETMYVAYSQIGPISISCDEGCSTMGIPNRENENVTRMDQRLPTME